MIDALGLEYKLSKSMFIKPDRSVIEALENPYDNTQNEFEKNISRNEPIEESKAESGIIDTTIAEILSGDVKSYDEERTRYWFSHAKGIVDTQIHSHLGNENQLDEDITEKMNELRISCECGECRQGYCARCYSFARIA